jgi:hypothetical protein
LSSTSIFRGRSNLCGLAVSWGIGSHSWWVTLLNCPWTVYKHKMVHVSVTECKTIVWSLVVGFVFCPIHNLMCVLRQ